MADELLADKAADVPVARIELLAQGYFRFERVHFTTVGPDGAHREQSHDLIRGGKAVGVLPVDPVREEVVLIRQFRPAAQLANGLGEMLEVVAGRVDRAEDLRQTAARECREEIGVAPSRLVQLLTFLPTPGLTDEEITLFLGVVDATQVPPRAGVANEQEDTIPLRVPIEAALTALARYPIHSGLTIVALQWLALNRARLGEIIANAERS